MRWIGHLRRMEEYLRTSSMENLPLANDPVAAHSWGTRTCANEIWKPWKSTPRVGKTLRLTAAAVAASSISNSRWREDHQRSHWKKDQAKRENNNWLRHIDSHLRLVRQGLPFPRWPHKPQVALFRAKHYELTVIGHSFYGRLRPKEAYYLLSCTK